MITTLLPYSRYIKAGAALAVVAALFGAGWKARGWLADAAIAEVQRAHSDAVAVGASAAAKLHAEYREQERVMQDHVTEISDDLTRQLQETEGEYTAALDAANTALGRLRIESARCTARLSSATRAADTASRNDDSAPERVVPESNSAVDLLSIARDADRVAARLSACQAYVTRVRAQF